MSSDPNITPMGFFQSMPTWAKGIVFALTTIPVAFAISGMILNVNLGTYLDTYMDIQLESMKNNNGVASEVIVDAINTRLDAVELRFSNSIVELTDRITQTEFVQLTSEQRLDLLESWACKHADVQGLTNDIPRFCE